MRFAWALLVATGCRGLLGIEDPQLVTDGTGGDGSIDAPDICGTWHPRLFSPCAIAAPGPALVLDASGTPYALDTTEGTLRDRFGTVLVTLAHIRQSDGSELALLDIASLSVQDAELDLTGIDPLLVASWDFIDIGGTIDAGSHRAGRIGPGGNGGCTAQAGTTGQDALASGGSGGGGGGALHGAGGKGATGDSGAVIGGIGGTAIANVPATLRAGCGGGASGIAGSAAVPPATAATRADGGAGGGAMHLAARLQITLTAKATLLAGGAGGTGAPAGSACGGGGGGSGGTIGIDAVTVKLDGVIAANGGGGGASAPFADPGNHGTDGQASAAAAPGGALHGGSCGLAGASGGAGTIASGANAAGSDTCGGGGGGGGAGFVVVWSTDFTDNGATISPAEILNPP